MEDCVRGNRGRVGGLGSGYRFPQHRRQTPTGQPSVEGEFRAQVGAETLDNQVKLERFKEWIKAHPGWQNDGYIDQVNDAAHDATTLLWSGDSALQEAALDHARAEGIAATVEQRPHSLPEILAAEAAIESHKSDLAAAGFTLTGIIGVQADTDAMQVEGTQSTTSARSLTLSAVQRNVSQVLDGISDVPTSLQLGVSTSTAVGTTSGSSADTAAPISTRQTDTAPHEAGALMTQNGEICSTGFSVVVGGTEAHPLTARHCISGGVNWQPAGGSGDSFGHTTEDSPDGAASMLSASGTDMAYDGAWDNSAGYSKLVINTFDPILNDLLCTGGGNSGEHCDIQVTSTAYAWDDGTGNGTVLSFIGTNIDAGQIADIQGDSGGPVISLYGTREGEVDAAGMIQGIQWDSTHPRMTGSDCGDVAFAGANACSQMGIFTSMPEVVDGWNNVTVDVN